MTVLTDHIHTFSRRLVSEGVTELGLTVKNLLDAIAPGSVLRQLPGSMARAASGLTAGMHPSAQSSDRGQMAGGI